MDWLALVVLAGIWAILLVPRSTRRTPQSPVRTEMPSDQEDFRQPGRRILSPRRGSRFVGKHKRERERARERRRRVFVFLLEAIAVTGLIGVFPPLRGMLVITGIFGILLAVYTAMVVQVSRTAPATATAQPATATPNNVVRLSEIQARPNPALREQEERLAKVGR